MPETSVIYDRNGKELYKIYDEKRTYVTYENISNDMINAIIAGEDKRFWEHPGYDAIGIFRALCMGILKRRPFSGTSGITQQLARVTYLSDERTIERKIKELYLSIEIESIFKKEEILELYLNKIFFGGNSYGVEQAAQTYFHLPASELGVFESSILSSLPKAPSGLSPYKNKGELLGFPIITTNIGNELPQKEKILTHSGYIQYQESLDTFSELLTHIQGSKRGRNLELCGFQDSKLQIKEYALDEKGCIEIHYRDLLSFLNSLYFLDNGKHIGYFPGRKDYILGRMLEDGYIDFDQYIGAVVKGFGYDFQLYRDDISSPHFVMYIKQQLIHKYGEDFLKRGGLKIYTTLDGDLQNKAGEIVQQQVEKNKQKFGANNAALISVDNKTGEVLSFIGGVDYFDDENSGKNNMIFARLQPGSTFKPFVYTLAMIKHGYDKDTIFTDEEFRFPGDYTPQNSDGKYLGKMTLSKALNYSRNIPAVKAYYAAGEEDEIIDFLEPFGIQNLNKFKKEYKKKYGFSYVYAAPMALGTVQISPWELAQAYSVYANSGIKRDIHTILKVEDKKGQLIEDFTKGTKEMRVLDEDQANEMNIILSSTHKRPSSWNYYLTLSGRDLAAKTGTSSKQKKSEIEGEDDIIEPKDLWTVGYTPQITTIVWAGNTSGAALKEDAYGITGAGPIMRDFMEFAHRDLEVKTWGRK